MPAFISTTLSFLTNFFTEIMVPFIFFGTVLPRKKFWYLPLIAALALDILFINVPNFYSTAGFMVLFGWLNLSFAVVFLITCFLFFFAVNIKVRHVLFYGSAAYAIQNIVHNIGFIVNDFFGNTFRSDFWFFVSFIVLAIFYAGFYFIIVRRIKKEESKAMDNKILVLTSVITIIITYFLSLFFLPTDSSNDIGRFYAALSCLFLLFLQFSVFDTSRMEEEKDMAEKMMEQSQKQFELYKENVEVINIKCHDLRHQLRTLRHQEGEIDKSSLKEIEQAINIYDNVAKTENPTLDILVTEYCLSAEKNHIQFTYLADGRKLSFLSESDINSIFGNALENAFESVMKLKDPEKRVISMNIYENGNMLTIHIDNYYEGDLKLVNGLPITSKEDKNYHGFGVRSIQLAVEKNKGQMKITTANHLFNLDILFLLND